MGRLILVLLSLQITGEPQSNFYEPILLYSLHFTSLHFTSLHFTSLHFTSLHFTSLRFASLHFTSSHLTSPHLTSPHFTSLHSSPLQSSPLHLTSLKNTKNLLYCTFIFLTVPYNRITSHQNSTILGLARSV